MLTTDEKHLTIFSKDLKVNGQLPKYKKELAEAEKMNVVDRTSYKILLEEGNLQAFNMSIHAEMMERFQRNGGAEIFVLNQIFDKEINRNNDAAVFTINGDTDVNVINGSASLNDTIWKRLKNRFFNRIKQTEEIEVTYELDILDFFANIKLVTDTSTEKYKNRVNEYINCMKLANDAGQTAFSELLLNNIIVAKYESVLYANDMYKCITEDVLVEFVKKSKKGLSLDYVTNFSRLIPTDVVAKIQKANELEVFDNYCILHYDPKQTAYTLNNADKEEIRKEAERKKDPIIFGMIKGSTKLYYVADWIDEVCDLTLEKLVDVVGAELIEKDYLKSEIDTSNLK